MKRSLFIFLLLATQISLILLQAQQPTGFELKGSVYTSDAVIAENATVMLFRSADSLFIAEAVCDSLGHYRFGDMNPDDYMLAISLLGYETLERQIVLKDNVEMEPLMLNAATLQLNEVKVTGQRAVLKLMADKLIFRPGSGTAKGNMAQLLPRLPGVQLSSAGELSLNGRKGVLLYLDNRKQLLSGDQLSVLLNSLDSEQVENIELIENPPAEYEAEGTGGIIRINRRKEFLSGESFFFSANLGQGRYGNGNISGRYEYQKGAFYMMADMSYYYRKEQNDLFLHRISGESNEPEESQHAVHQSFYRTQTNKGYAPSLRIDYQLTKPVRIGLETNWNQNHFKAPIHAISEFHSFESTDSTRVSNSLKQTSRNRLSNNLYLLYSDSPKRELLVNIDLIYYLEKGKTGQLTHLLQNNATPDEDTEFHDESRNEVALYALQTDYRYSFNERTTLKVGARTNLSKLNQQNRYTHHTYNEWISGLYVSGETRINRLALQGGVRAEFTQINGDTLMNRSYLNLFPTASLRYEYSEKGSISMQYTLRIKRPGYNQLNPQVSIFDNYTFEKGNPLLREELSHTVSLIWMYRNKLRIMPYYSHSKDAITKNFILQEYNRVMIMPENLPRAWETGVRLNLMGFMPAKFWQCNVYLNGYYREYTFRENGANRRHGKSALIAQVNNHFYLPAGICAEVSGNLYTPFAEGRARIKGGGELWCGISKSFCRDRLQLTLTGRDLLSTIQEGLNIEIGGAHTEATSRQDKRRVELSLSWSFNRGKKWKNSDRQPHDNEKNRINL
ncbi:MAG: outer membrane beta-barrel family protein [Bacteroidales bacterium]